MVSAGEVAEALHEKFPGQSDNTDTRTRRAVHAGHSRTECFSERRDRRCGRGQRADNSADNVHDGDGANQADRRLKSLGMSNIRIAWTIVQEALLISLGGVIFGVVATVILKLAADEMDDA